jgi:8-oxo-dGTP pyrophosphatase MutT (NUDIX family)
MEKRWEKLKSRYLIKRWWLNLREDHVRLPNGVELPDYHIMECPNWACVVCQTESGDVVLVEQYRYGIDEVMLELPGGALDADEDPMEAAKRELLEETGYVAEEWTYLGHCAPDPPRHTNDAYLFFARNGRHVKAQDLDRSEEMNVHLVPAQTLMEQVDASKIRHGIHLTAIFWSVYRNLLDLG